MNFKNFLLLGISSGILSGCGGTQTTSSGGQFNLLNPDATHYQNGCQVKSQVGFKNSSLVKSQETTVSNPVAYGASSLTALDPEAYNGAFILGSSISPTDGSLRTFLSAALYEPDHTAGPSVEATLSTSKNFSKQELAIFQKAVFDDPSVPQVDGECQTIHAPSEISPAQWKSVHLLEANCTVSHNGKDASENYNITAPIKVMLPVSEFADLHPPANEHPEIKNTQIHELFSKVYLSAERTYENDGIEIRFNFMSLETSDVFQELQGTLTDLEPSQAGITYFERATGEHFSANCNFKPIF